MKAAPAGQGEGHQTNRMEIQVQDISQIERDRSPFDAIRRTRDDGTEFWSARDLMPLLGYEKWERFAEAVNRAVTALTAQGADVDREASRLREPFGRTNQMGENFHLSRFAAYQVAMCGDPRKPEVAAALAYFAIRTREAETAGTPALPKTMSEALRLAADEYDRAELEKAARVEAEAHAKSLEAPASAWKHMAASQGDYMVRDAAKVLSRDPNIEIGQQRLFKFMQAEGWTYRERGAWKAYQSQVDCGRLVEKLNRPYLNERTGQMEVPAPSIRITPKGLAELHKRLGGGPDGPSILGGAA